MISICDLASASNIQTRRLDSLKDVNAEDDSQCVFKDGSV